MKPALTWFAVSCGLAAAGFLALAAGERRWDLAEHQKQRVVLVARAVSWVAAQEAAADDEQAAGLTQRFAAAVAQQVPGISSALVLRGAQYLAHSDASLAGARLSRDSLADKALYDQFQRLKATFRKNQDERERNPALERNAYAELELQPVEGGALLAVAAPVDRAGEFEAMAEVRARPLPLRAPLPWATLGLAAAALAAFSALAWRLRGPTLVVLGAALMVGTVALQARVLFDWRGEVREMSARGEAKVLGALASAGLFEAVPAPASAALEPDAPKPAPASGLMAALTRSAMGVREDSIAAVTPADAPAPEALRSGLRALTEAGHNTWFRQSWFDAQRRADAGHLLQWALGLGLLAAGAFALGSLGQMNRFGRALVQNRTAYFALSPAMVGMLVLVFIPVVFGIVLGFMERRYNVFEFAGISNYVAILSDLDVANPQNFYFKLAVTVAWTVINVSLHVSIGLFLALMLNDPILRARGLFRVLLIVPWALPNYITALIWKGMFHKQFGAVNFLLDALGAEPVAWFQSFGTAFTTNVVTNVWLGFPFMMVISLGALQSIPADLYEAAQVDGSTRWQRFRFITLPLLMPALVPAVIVGTVWTFNMFNIIYLVSGGAPNGATDILITDAFRWAFERDRYGYAAAYSTLIFLLLLGFTLATNRVTRATKGAFE